MGFFLSQALQWLRQDFFLRAVSERACFGEALWTCPLFAADDKSCFSSAQISDWLEPCIEEWGAWKEQSKQKASLYEYFE